MEGLFGVIAVVIIILVVGISLAALATLCDLIWPRLIARAQHNAEHRPIRSFVVGLLNFTFFGLIAAALGSRGEAAQLLALIVATTLLSFVAIGLTAVARLVGKRVRPDEPNLLRQLLAGMFILELAALVPLVGWIAVPALAGLVGYGATIIALLWRRMPTVPVPPLTQPTAADAVSVEEVTGSHPESWSDRGLE